VQVACSSAGVVGNRDKPGGSGEVTGAGKCGEVTGGDEQCGTKDGTESRHGLDGGGLGVLVEDLGYLASRSARRWSRARVLVASSAMIAAAISWPGSVIGCACAAVRARAATAA
jgi:hypothetical protein